MEQAIEGDRALDFLDRYGLDILGGEKGEVYASNRGSYRLGNVHGWFLDPLHAGTELVLRSSALISYFCKLKVQ